MTFLIRIQDRATAAHLTPHHIGLKVSFKYPRDDGALVTTGGILKGFQPGKPQPDGTASVALTLVDGRIRELHYSSIINVYEPDNAEVDERGWYVD